MTRSTLLAAGLLASAAFVTPAMAGMEVTQEPGNLGFNYPDSHYMTGGYGVRASPGPGFYYRYPAPGAMYEIPAPGYVYGYYGAPAARPYWLGR